MAWIILVQNKSTRALTSNCVNNIEIHIQEKSKCMEFECIHC